MNKISKDINIKKTRVGKIIFRPSDHSIGWIERLVSSNFKKLNKFYKINPPEINLEFIYSRKEFNNKIGRHTPQWMAAVALKNTIFIFSPLVIERVSTHKKSKLYKIIIHELCHIFNNQINKEILTWVNEGTALFLAHQKKAKDFKKSDWQFFINNFSNKNIDLQSFAEHEGYKISYWAIRAIVEKFSINRILNLIKINPRKDDFKSKLNKILMISTKDF